MEHKQKIWDQDKSIKQQRKCSNKENSSFQEKCLSCKGSGIIDVDKELAKMCPACMGNGYTDWVSNMTGVKPISKIFERITNKAFKRKDLENSLND